MLLGESLLRIINPTCEVWIIDGYDTVGTIHNINPSKYYEIKISDYSHTGVCRVFIEECIVNEPFLDDTLIDTNKCEIIQKDVLIRDESSTEVQEKNIKNEENNDRTTE